MFFQWEFFELQLRGTRALLVGLLLVGLKRHPRIIEVECQADWIKTHGKNEMNRALGHLCAHIAKLGQENLLRMVR